MTVRVGSSGFLASLCLAACACAPAPDALPPPLPPPTARAPSVAAARPASAGIARPTTEAPPAGRPCGELGCLAFDTPRAAFEHALAGDPRVVAVGEAHAQKAVPGIESATARFSHDLLPLLAPRAKGIVIELLAPDRRCEKHEEQAVKERTKPVTEPQRDTNQSEFVALGFAAKKLGMQAEPLIPTCDELAQVLAATNDVGALLELIATITVREATDFLDHQPPASALVIYGGLVHNDLDPAPGHERWSFGPPLSEHAKGSYVEIDLIVPELIRNEPPWTSLPWLAHYDRAAEGRETVLFATGPASFVLIFPESRGSSKSEAVP